MQIRRTLALAVLVVVLPHFTYAASAGMQVSGASAQEAHEAQIALGKVVDLFDSIGAHVEPDFKLIFQDQVILPGNIPAYGYYDTDTREIHILHFQAPGNAERRPWNLAWGDAVATSMLLHEITHMVAISYMGDQRKRISHTWHEAIAYAVQFELMDPSLRASIFEQFPTARPYDDQEAVNSFVYMTDPDEFALRTSLSIPTWGGRPFLKDLMDGKINGTQERPTLW